MNSIQLFVCDTNALISFFNELFETESVISWHGREIIQKAFEKHSSEVRISIPSIVFIEIYEKWALNEEFLAKFYYEALIPILDSPFFEIKPIEKEVLENIVKIHEHSCNLELNDMIILSSAMMLNCPLITSDSPISDFVKVHKVIPAIIN